ncbi:MAG: glycosyltransferase [Muribaculaceae bacterium]|nr:glycosyltransferase [Muribaculaceae bacterium]
MKVLIASKFFYTRGGAELVAIYTRQMLIEHGHQVRVFAMDYHDNIPLDEHDTFPTQVNPFGSLSDKVKAARRALGLGDVRIAARRALDEFQPDVVHLHNVHTYLSPIIAEEAHKRGIRVVWTLHDYKPICPSYSCRRPDGTICRECFRKPGAVLKYKCMKGSLPASILAWIEARRWDRKRLERCIDTFIAPSVFMGKKLVEAGFDKRKIEVLCNCLDPEKLKTLQEYKSTDKRQSTNEPYFCYIGRLSHEKGVETMLKASDMAGIKLKVAGRGPLLEQLKATYGDNPNIQFLGHLDAPQVAILLRNAAASVLPSEWYENNPLGVIESLSAGTPVIGADMGGIPELIELGKDGFTFPAFDAEALSNTMLRTLKQPFDREDIAARAAIKFGRQTHYNKLIGIYKGDIIH